MNNTFINATNKLVLILVLVSSSLIATAQSAKLNAFYAKYRHKPNTIAMAVPGWLVKLGINLSEDKEDIDEYRSLLRGLSHINVLVMEENNYSSPQELKRLVKDVKKRQFIDLISVKDEGTRVNILVREKQTKRHAFIKNVMILVAEEDELVLVTLNGRWKKSMLEQMLKDNNVNLVESLGGIVARDSDIVDNLEDIADNGTVAVEDVID